MPLLSHLRRTSAAAHVSVADVVRAAGFDPQALEGRNVGTRAAAAATFAACDGTLITGIVYRADYRAEEESGIGALRLALTGQDPRNVTMTKGARENVARFADVNGFVVSTRRRRANTLAWGDDLETCSRSNWRGEPHPAGFVPGYAHHYEEQLAWVRRDELGKQIALGKVPMAELRTRAKALGLGDLPRKKRDLEEAILTSAQYLTSADLADVWPAWFHYGRELVVRADAGATAVVVEALGEAIDAGTLAVGSYSGPFAQGLFLYDGRDETDAIRADRDAQQTWYGDRMSELEPVAAELEAAGHTWFFLGNPSEFTAEDGTVKVRYWLNGSGGGRARDGVRCHRQPFGWYTLEQLRAEDFIRDAVAREASEARREAARAR